MSETREIDGYGPLPVARPGQVNDVAALIREASAGGTALYPIGGGTSLALGNPPSQPGRVVDLRGLDQIIDFPARDMTVTVQAGITMKSLADTLARENLRLPIDVPRSETATLGGVLAANVNGARRYGFGTLRDYVIGISALNDEGREFKAGGRVVKNVAGYDLCKLLVGSLGTLGIITQVTLKLRPLPEIQAVLLLHADTDQLERLLATLHASRTRPSCIELINRAAAGTIFQQVRLGEPESAWVGFVGYEGNVDAVAWQVQQIIKEVGKQCRIDGQIDFTAKPLCNAMIEFGAEATTFKATMLPGATAEFCRAVDIEPARPQVRSHAGSGIVYGHWDAGLTLEQAASMLKEWRELAAEGKGDVVVTRCPSAWKQTLDVWGPPRNDAWLMRDVKAKFDPKGIFNPGRFVDGI
mgnify:CR=1 FL=1